MANYNKAKGYKFERDILDELLSAGHDATRVFASGAGAHDIGDIALRYNGFIFNVECKWHKNPADKSLKALLSDRDILIYRGNNQDPYVLMPFKILLDLLNKND